MLYGDWSIIQNAISEKYDTDFGGPKKNTEKYIETKKKALRSKPEAKHGAATTSTSDAAS